MEWEQRGHKDRLLYELTGQVSFPFMAVGLYAISSGQLIMQIAFIRTVRAGDCFYCQQDNRKRIEEQDCVLQAELLLGFAGLSHVLGRGGSCFL